MKRIATITRLKPGAETTYQQLHESIWPEVVAAAHEANIRNYTIFRSGEYLFSYFEYIGSDYSRDLEEKNSKPATQRWQQITGQCLCEEDAVLLDEMWHLNF